MNKNSLLSNIHIVLVEPKNAGNIGSAVRAMKNMGISKLRLVNPVEYREEEEQKKLGYRSQEIIEKSKEYSTLKDALEDISTAFLATTRKGKWKKDFLSPKETAGLVCSKALKEKVAVIFGREDSGVTIDESQSANYFINIPAAVKYPSLNLSQAVMVTVYEIYSASLEKPEPPPFPKMAKKKEFKRLYDNIWSLMQDLHFMEDDKGLFHRSLKRALNRTHWSKADIAVFDRACKQVRWFMENRVSGNRKKEEIER